MAGEVGESPERDEPERDVEPGPGNHRPYWLKPPIEVYLGFARGQWPIAAFGEESQARDWVASGDEGSRALLGPIAIPDEMPALMGIKIPAQVQLVRYDS